jgi:hypothetical protein
MDLTLIVSMFFVFPKRSTQSCIVLCFCFVFRRLVHPMLPVSLDCPILIVPSVFSNVYLYSLHDCVDRLGNTKNIETIRVRSIWQTEITYIAILGFHRT